LGLLLGAKDDVAIAMYDALSSTVSKRDVLMAAAEKTLTPDEMEIFNALMSLFKSSASERNDIAHGIWAYSKDKPDHMLLITSDEYVKHQNKIDAAHAGRFKKGIGLDKSKIQTYKRTEFDKISQKIAGLCVLFKWFRMSLPFSNHQGDVPHQNLIRSPQILEALSRKADEEKKKT